jgi:hypothetical protein
MIKGKDLHITDSTWAETILMNQNMYMPTNKYDYRLSNCIHIVKRLPLSIKGVIYQKGFSALLPNRIFNKLLGILFRAKRKRQEVAQQTCLKETLNKMEGK